MLLANAQWRYGCLELLHQVLLESETHLVGVVAGGEVRWWNLMHVYGHGIIFMAEIDPILKGSLVHLYQILLLSTLFSWC